MVGFNENLLKKFFKKIELKNLKLGKYKLNLIHISILLIYYIRNLEILILNKIKGHKSIIIDHPHLNILGFKL